MGQSWSTKDIPSLKGKTAIVTGVTYGGIGYPTALELGRAGAHVVLLARDKARGEDALSRMQRECPDASYELALVDVANFASIRSFAKSFVETKRPLDILVNNAGIMMLPKRELSADGFELQTATNHLGPFLLTGLLLPSLQRASEPRVVNVASLMQWAARLDPKAIDFKYDAKYDPVVVYGNTKLSNLLFTHELAKRYPKIRVVASHPGGTNTNLQKHAYNSRWSRMMMQSPEVGALPSLRAATDPNAPQGGFYGPIMGMWGAPVLAWKRPAAKDDNYSRALWEASEAATGVKY